LFLAVLGTAGCGADTTPPTAAAPPPPRTDGGLPADQGRDAGQVAVDSSTPAMDAAADPGPATCNEVVAPAGLPSAQGRFVHTGGAGAQTPPAQTGGDPTGRWALSGVTVYLPPEAALLINAEASTVAGNGWLELRDGRLVMGMDMDLALYLGDSPFVEMPLQSTAIVNYSISGNTLQAEVVCVEGVDSSDPALQGQELTIGESAPFTVTGDTATAVFTFGVGIADVELLVNLSRLP